MPEKLSHHVPDVPEELAQRSPAAVQAMFGRVAYRYDVVNKVLTGGMDIYWRSRLVGAVKKQQPARVLDLATGSGDVLLALEQARVFTERAIGADFCVPMLEQAHRKNLRSLVAGDGLQLPFRTASFDAVTISFGLRNLVDRPKGMEEMRRILRPGGRAYILEFSRPIAVLAPLYFWYLHHILPRWASWFTTERGAYSYLGESIQAFPRPPELAEMLQQAGFQKVHWQRITFGLVALHIAEV